MKYIIALLIFSLSAIANDGVPIQAFQYKEYMVVCLADSEESQTGLCGVINYNDLAVCTITDIEPVCPKRT